MLFLNNYTEMRVSFVTVEKWALSSFQLIMSDCNSRGFELQSETSFSEVATYGKCQKVFSVEL